MSTKNVKSHLICLHSQSLEEGDTKARRREQVRRAQRAHRDRKATYVKTLESEVAKLRARDAAQDAEIRAYRDTIRRLRELLHYHDIAMPPDLTQDQLHSPQATIEVFDLPDHTQSLRAQMPIRRSTSSSDFPQLLPTSTQAAGQRAGLGSTAVPFFDSTDPSATAPVADPVMALYQRQHRSYTSPHPQRLDSSQVGVDFVLALEQVCFSHRPFVVAGTHSDSEEGTGHTMMLLGPIMTRSPPLRKTTRAVPEYPEGTTWSVPAGELERLLQLSERLSLDGEITPVEAWQRIRHHPHFANLTADVLETLRAGLIPETQCYGFGAVIDEAYFEYLLSQSLGPAR